MSGIFFVDVHDINVVNIPIFAVTLIRAQLRTSLIVLPCIEQMQ